MRESKQHVRGSTCSRTAIRAARSVVKAEIAALQQLDAHFPANVSKAIHVLSNITGKIVTAGIGKSGIAAQKMAATLSSYGIPSIRLNVGDALHGDVGVIQGSDALVLISQSGTSTELEQIAHVAKSRGAHVVGVFGTGTTLLAKLCTVVLICKVRETACPIALAPMSVTATTIALLDSVSAGLLVSKGFSKQSFAENHPLGLLGRKLNCRVSDVMLNGPQVPRVVMSARIKDALLEMCRCEVGAVCVVSHKGTLQGLITDGDIRRALLTNDDVTRPVQEVMNQSPKVLSADSSLLAALQLMESQKSKFYVAPVVDNSRVVVGLVRLHDIVD
jgi:arabinose-5-phosphate isomerase